MNSIREQLKILAETRIIIMKQEAVIASSRRKVERQIVELNLQELNMKEEIS